MAFRICVGYKDAIGVTHHCGRNLGPYEGQNNKGALCPKCYRETLLTGLQFAFSWGNYGLAIRLSERLEQLEIERAAAVPLLQPGDSLSANDI